MREPSTVEVKRIKDNLYIFTSKDNFHILVEKIQSFDDRLDDPEFNELYKVPYQYVTVFMDSSEEREGYYWILKRETKKTREYTQFRELARITPDHEVSTSMAYGVEN